MPCYHPLRAFQDGVSSAGKLVLSWSGAGTSRKEVFLPCGQCIGCRLERSRQWAMRCLHEASLYEDNCFLTLTYDDEHLPVDCSLDVSEFQRFMKRLRKEFGAGIRFYHCGEYGELLKRPHYHAIIFNHDFEDKVLLTEDNGFKLFSSERLSRLWPFGFCTIGALTFESAAYVARYVVKKVTGDEAESHYGGRKPEYSTMSRRPGIGRGWYEKFHSDVFPSDEVIINGRSVKPPRYYDGLLEVSEKELFDRLKAERKRLGSRMELIDGVLVPRTDDVRLCEKELVKRASMRSLSREVE